MGTNSKIEWRDAGPDLDARVARALGWTFEEEGEGDDYWAMWYRPDGTPCDLPAYSTDLAYVGEMMEWLHGTRYWLIVEDKWSWSVTKRLGNGVSEVLYRVRGANLCEACCAAVMALAAAQNRRDKDE